MLPRVMVVEDERIVAFDLKQRLSELCYEVPAIAASCEEALRKAEQTKPDLILMDIRIQGDLDGIETASRLQSVCPAPIVYLSAYSEDTTLDRARATRPYGYLLKPFSEREMHATIQMALERHRFEGALQRSEERLRLALEAADMGILDLDTGTFKADLAGRSAQILGLGESRTRASCAALLSCVDEVDRDRVRQELRRSMEQPAPCRIEFRRTGREGRRRWIRAQGRNYSPVTSASHRMIGVIQDITAHRTVEEEIRKLNEELQRVVAMHSAELRASAADLDGLSYLRQICDALLDDASARDLNRLHATGQRLSELIDTLLKLSHITRTELRRSPVDLSAMAARVVQELREAEPQRAVECIIAPDAIVNADPDLMQIVVGNLLGNAWKFTSKHTAATIEFGVTHANSETAYFVRDDGAGFDVIYVDKLFGAFQRLHDADEFGGIGAGLATVQRIIQRHGGRIWAEAVVEQGAIFRFTVPGPAPLIV